MNSKVKILIGILILGIIIALGSIFYSRWLCVDSNEQCQGSPDGRGCTTGVWCDQFGRICGGRSCVGLGTGVCANNKCVTLEAWMSMEGVTIATDETEYKRGAFGMITIRNNLEKSIWGHFNTRYSTQCGGTPFWGLQRLENDKWRDLNFSFPVFLAESQSGVACEFILCERGEPVELKSGSDIYNDLVLWDYICEWPEQAVGVPKTNPKHIEDGTYKIFLTYGLGREGFDLLEERTTYSNEFTIKYLE